MSTRRVLWLTIAVLLAPAAARADTLAPLLAAYDRGQYELVIDRASELIAAADEPMPDVHYLRGLAAYRIGWFTVAEEDMTPLAESPEARRWPNARKIVDNVARLRELGPQRVREVCSGRDVLFRVYYDVDDKWTRSLIAALGEAQRAVTQFYGVTMSETDVFVFADKDRRAAFSEILFGHPPSEWAWASASNGMLFFCPYAPGYETRQSPSQLPDTIAHEYSHCLTHRVLGTAAMPRWLDEGLAMHCASLLRAREVEENDIALTRMWFADAILPLRVISDNSVFRDTGMAAQAYTQGYAMVRFALAEMGRDGVLAMLNDLKATGRFDTVMEETWNGGLTGFYEDWLAATERRVEKFK
jgi:hypothetical protein